jgi:hypothetical protein
MLILIMEIEVYNLKNEIRRKNGRPGYRETG